MDNYFLFLEGVVIRLSYTQPVLLQKQWEHLAAGNEILALELLGLLNETFSKSELRLMLSGFSLPVFLTRGTSLPSLAAVAVECGSSLKWPISSKISSICSPLDTRETYCWSKKEGLCKLAHLLQVKNKNSLFFVFAFCSVVKVGLGKTSANPSLGQFSGYVFFVFNDVFFCFVKNISVYCLNVLRKSKT